MDHFKRPDGISAPNASNPTTIVPRATGPLPSYPTSTSTLSSASSIAPAIPAFPLTSSSSSSSSLHHAPAPMMEIDKHSLAEDRSRRATSVLSMDDLEAAQALEGLRSDYGHSRTPSHTQSLSPESQPQSEPLISLLTSTHPLISSAIHGSVSAYTTSKSYSPRFKSSAEFIERNIGSPVANTVGSVGRKTGVESGLRWALQRKPSERDSKRSKRRKVGGENHPTTDPDVEKGPDDALDEPLRSPSEMSTAETLPPYDDLRSPNYEEIGRDHPSQRNPTWQSRLVISTSGLGVAMSEESLRSLQYCLTWLRWANGRLGKAIQALQAALKEWDAVRQESGDGQNHTLLTQRIQAVKADVLQTLKQVVEIVSKYAGGALPDNARNLVRRHLTSLPHRFQVASNSHPPPDSMEASSDDTLGAHRILVLAQEGLDMMGQVSGVVNDTLVSAEHWCDRLGRRRPDTKTPDTVEQPASNGTFPADVKPPITEPQISEPQDLPMTGTDEKV
ncbi:putative clock controled protein (Ccg-8) [Aspergillus candidus]|uniref:Opi1-domain-containing protein n=1 Tax=Aspergillus candidus TaxID=41067 RepID=A0A2I2F570_ASPCN|nr:Opi1-domain-containing protein [Aspergillus candidus]PLB35771.1 Opi1-domain-containing protein [Aspergillus candidus]